MVPVPMANRLVSDAGVTENDFVGGLKFFCEGFGIDERGASHGVCCKHGSAESAGRTAKEVSLSMARSPLGIRYSRFERRKRAAAKLLKQLSDDFEGAHHVVGFVLEDVAVVEVFAGVALELDDDAGYGAGGALDGVFPARFVRSGRQRLSQIQHLLGLEVLDDIERAAIEDLEANQMQMHGVGVFGEVNELPYLG